ncbi:MAG: glycosyltransferase [Cyanobacteriota bacterium]|nr:glycosyltransferase [Cyanobacteriota bacterium]
MSRSARLRLRLRRTAARFYHSDLLLPHRLKRQWRQRLLDPLLQRRRLAGRGGDHNSSDDSGQPASSDDSDGQRQRDANLLFSDSARRDLAWFLADPTARLRIGLAPQAPSQPLVSLVLVLFNKAELSYACLRSLEQLRYPNLELIVVDNASSDQTPALLERLDGRVTVLSQEQNLHFLRGCNIAFGQLDPASQYVLLVNNDALVDPLAVDQALAVFQRWPRTGIVGGQVLHLDGQLQEAGNVIFRDGICSGLGRRRSPFHPLAQVRRQVDYVSGCLLMIETALLQALGGFDERFAPAYYEETDLCIRSWQAGRPVVYEPGCRLHHVEFASSSDGQSEAMALMQRNRGELEAKHQSWLQSQPRWDLHRDLETVSSCLRREAYPARVLWIDDRNPDPRFGAGYGRLNDLIGLLADLGCFITIFATHQQPDPALHTASADYELRWGGLPELEQLLAQRPGFYSHICASRQHNLRLLQAWLRSTAGCRNGGVASPTLVGDIESLFSIRDQSRNHLHRTGSILRLPADQWLALPMLQDELQGLTDLDRFLAVSQREADLIEAVLRKPVAVAGHAFLPTDPQNLPHFADTRGLLFMGAMTHPDLPNLDSLAWLAESVLPALKNQGQINPQEAPLTVIGPSRDDLVQPLLDRIAAVWPVRHLGQVARVEPELLRHRILLAPTRFAAGLPHKVQHAISQGIPVVTTELIASQMHWQSGEGLLCSDEATGFAAQIVALYRDQALWECTRAAGLIRIHQECRQESLRLALAQTFLIP